MKVADIMHANPVCVGLNENLSNIAKHMKKGDFGSILVNDGDKTLGILTDRDIVVRAIANDSNLVNIQAKDIMSKKLITCDANDSLEDAALKMKNEKIRRLAVLDKNMKAIGILSLGDIAIAEKGKEKGPAFEALEKISQH